MENTWKITSTGKSDQPIKVTIRVENTKTIAVAVAPGEFVLAMPYKTAQLEAQTLKRNFLKIEEEFDNSYSKLELGKIYKENIVDEIKKSI
jgi:hypothetical protein